MTSIRYRMAVLAEAISKDRGGLALLGLFERDSMPGEPDLIVAADWVDSEREYEAISYVVDQMKKHLEPQDFVSFNRVVVLQSEDEFVRAVQSFVPGPIDATRDDALAVVGNIRAAGIDIIRAVIAHSSPGVGAAQETGFSCRHA